MTMWIVTFAEDGSNHFYKEYYTNREAAETRKKYFENRFFRAWVNEEAILDEPRKGAPKGWAMWDGVKVEEG